VFFIEGLQLIDGGEGDGVVSRAYKIYAILGGFLRKSHE
jgi:hypothetical protein